MGYSANSTGGYSSLIDDVDRLDQESMRYMFRLIRLNADFDSVTYVLAFDRDVVESVLTMEQGVSGHEYLEKIVQVGFDIPPAEPSKLKQIFLQRTKSLGLFTPSNEEDAIPLDRTRSSWVLQVD